MVGHGPQASTHFGVFISKLAPVLLSIFHRNHIDAIPLDPHPFRGPSLRRLGGASDSKDVEPERFRLGLVARSEVPMVEATKVSAHVVPGIVSSATVTSLADVDVLEGAKFK
ncbi:hypothetical protein B0H13DRAFT_1890197 [Mycena leptocephala]|nr:hypothetical protein B0H13DRAFT_1890197 [Mycena leptocephala]